MTTRSTCSDCKRRLALDSITYCRTCDRLVCCPCDRARHAHATTSPTTTARFVCVRLAAGFTWCPDTRCPTRVGDNPKPIRKTDVRAHMAEAHPRLVRG